MIQRSSGFKKILFSLFFILPFILGSSNQAIFQNEYFYLSNHTTFSPGSEVTVNLSKSGRINHFNFKLLKIENPAGFFADAEKNSIRYNFDIWGKDKEVLLKYTTLKKEWSDFFGGSKNYYDGRIKVGKINEPGFYILQAISNDNVAYCGIVVSDLSMVYKNSGKQLIAFIANVRTGQFISDVNFKLFTQNKLAVESKSDKDGLVILDIIADENFNNNENLIIAQTSDEVVLSNPYFYFGRGGSQSYTAYIYTNQPVYRPSQEVFFKGIMREHKGNEIINLAEEDFSVTIKSPKNKEIFSADLKTNDIGTFSGSVVLDENADLGSYQIIVSKNSINYYGSFSVEEYKKPEYLVTVTPTKNQYAGGDLIEAAVKADYYFGSPVTTGKVNIKIFKGNYWRPWWYWSDYAWFYKDFYRPAHGSQRQLIHQTEGTLNNDGEFIFDYPAEKDLEYDLIYTITAEVTDNSRRTISGSADIYVTRGSFTLSTSPERYFIEKNKTIGLKINAADFADKPVQTSFGLEIRFPSKNNPYRSDPDGVEKLSGKTDREGKAVINYTPPAGYTGQFHYIVTAHDEKERQITARGSFFVSGEKEFPFQHSSGSYEIITDKDSYEKGEYLTAYISLPEGGAEFLLTYESEEILHYKKITTTDNYFEIKEKLNEIYSPSFNITATFFNGGQFYSIRKLVGVLAKDKFLEISAIPNNNIFKPGDEAEYLVSVKDFNGRPVRNTELSFGVIDESIYAIKNDESPDIQKFYYSPSYSYIPTYNSYHQNYMNGRSRPVTFIDKYYYDGKINFNKKGNGRLEGKVVIKGTENPAKNVKVLLTIKSNYYMAVTDSAGKYFFNNIPEDSYDIFALLNNGEVILIKKVKVEKKSVYNFEVERSIESDFQDNDVRTGREEPMFFVAEMDASPMSKSSGVVGEKKSQEYVQADLRSNFVDAVVWMANIRTDWNGKAAVSFKMPDNLTTWRTTVKGITADTKVGQTINKVISRKDLLVRMETPRFFREGDELIISTIVHNYLNEKKTTKISFDAVNLNLIESRINTVGYNIEPITKQQGSYEITIDKNSEVRIDWKVKVVYPIGEARLTASALTNEESDAMEVKVPILPNGIKQVYTLASDFSDENKTETLNFVVPIGVDVRTAQFSFSVNPSLAGTVLKALDDLAGYPYGCVEQTMSRFLPTIIASNTFKNINAPLKSSVIDELPKMVDAGLKRLYNFQHDDGGWGWWNNDATNPYMTAYVVYGLSLAKNAGYNIDEKILAKGIQNLQNQIQNFNADDYTTLAYMINSYTTAMKGEDYSKKTFKDFINVLEKKDLNAYSLSLLILSLDNMEEKNLAEKLSHKLIAMAEVGVNYVYWGGEQSHYRWQNDKVQGTAYAVKSLIQTGNTSELITKAVKWLVLQKQGFSWRSTQETATVIFALTDYLKVTDELNPDFTVEVLINGKKKFEKSFTNSDIFKEIPTIKTESSDIISGKNSVTIIKKGKGKIYFSGMNEYYSKDQFAAAKPNKFSINREYYILRPEESSSRIIYLKKKFEGELKSGDELLVKTFVESNEDNLQYFILEDMLPSGFEIVKDTENYEIDGENNYQPYPYYRHWRWFYADKEYRDEKVAFFVTNTSSNMEFSYIIKAQIPGEFSIMPAQGYLMYYPEVNGNSSVVSISVKDN
jgi:alpha-2-macroglobulin